MNERPKNSVADAVFMTVVAAIRSTRDPKAVAAVVDELAAEHGSVLVNAVLEAVELRLDDERRVLAAVRAIPPRSLIHEQQQGSVN